MNDIAPGYYWFRHSKNSNWEIIKIGPPNDSTGNQAVSFSFSEPSSCTHLERGETQLIPKPLD